ncbi:MAG: carbohydrate ABC transporter permease [Rickettsia endosymbiont of Ixodes persulcatus]|nr:carbohydrate ABC transporter permease [Rickettsia endosymbiont of Ixodes persulcatus]
MLSTSLKTSSNALAVPPQWIPNPIVWRNYLDVFIRVPFAQFLMNTVLHSLSVTTLEVGVSIIVAYGFARFKFKGKKFLFMFLLMTIMLPGEITIVPGYIYWVELGELLNFTFINTYIPLVLPAIGGQAVHIFFMSQYFRTIPKDFSEAAYINGANSWKILWKVYIPMSMPAIITIAISSFMGTWNSFLSPMIYLNTMDKFNVQVGLAMFQGINGANIDWAVLMAATTNFSITNFDFILLNAKIFYSI